MKLDIRFIVALMALFFLMVESGLAQPKVSPIEKDEHLKMLKEGILLVRLPNIDKKLAALEKANLHKRAEQEKKENGELHSAVIEMFEKYYKYNTFYFFNSRDSEKVLKREFEATIFDVKGKEVDIANLNVSIYIGNIGKANPAGETGRYNGEGVLILHLDKGVLYGIPKDIFYKGGGYSLAQMFSIRKVMRNAVRKLNYNLNLKFKLLRS